MSNPFKKKPTICFVTNELYPVDRGGIGRILYNFAVYNREMGKNVDIHFLVGGELARDRKRIQRLSSALKGLAKIHVVPELTKSVHALPKSLGYARQASNVGAESVLSTSYEFYLGLLNAERKLRRTFDIVEFPDFGGWGKVSLEAKRARMAFEQTELSVRIHSTQGILYKFERYAHVGGSWLSAQFDAEQFAIKYADRVIAHIPSVLDYTLSHFGLCEHHNTSGECEFPPIFKTKDANSEATQPDASSDEPDYIFSSRLQHFKRPDLFVRAAIAFLEKHPDYRGKFRIVSYGWDDEYIQMLMGLVPMHHKEKIVFKLDSSSDERLADISRSVVVQPSDYESLCLFAYEASTMGRPIILNEACLAFGAFDRWKAGDNCLFFDGTVPGLVATMEKARTWRPATQVDVTPDVPYWIAREHSAVERDAFQSQPLTAFTTIFFGLNPTSNLQGLRRNLLTLSRGVEKGQFRTSACLVMLQNKNMHDPEEVKELESLGAKVVFNPGVNFDPEMLAAVIKEQTEDEDILLVPFSVQFTEAFITEGARAMSANRDISLLGGHLDVYDETSGLVTELRTYFGEAPNTATMNARIMSPMLFMRRRVLDHITFDFRAGPYWFESFARTAALEGEHMVVLPMIAGRMDFLAAQQPENSKKLSSAVLDIYGSQTGLSARLLSLELAEPERSEVFPEYRLSNDELARTSLLSPKTYDIQWNPVEFHQELGGLLVHPLEDMLTIGALQTMVDNPLRVEAVARNANKRNLGCEVALAFGSDCLSADRLSQIITGKVESDDVILGKWLDVLPGESNHYSMWIPSEVRQKRGSTLYFLSRTANGKSSDQCHLVLSNVLFAFA